MPVIIKKIGAGNPRDVVAQMQNPPKCIAHSPHFAFAHDPPLRWAAIALPYFMKSIGTRNGGDKKHTHNARIAPLKDVSLTMVRRFEEEPKEQHKQSTGNEATGEQVKRPRYKR